MPALDGARGIAVLLVLLHHGDQHWRLPPLLHLAAVPGWCGVDLFFVLSGFLITGILLRSRDTRQALPKFVLRRALRIFPLAYASLLLCYELSEHHVDGFPPQSADVWRWFALYGGNFYVMFHSWPTIEAVAVMWSLAIEEQFYLVWPFVVLRSPRWLIASIAVVLIVAAPLVRLHFWPEHAGVSSAFTLGRDEGLALGALLALAFERPALRVAVASVSRALALPALWLALRCATEVPGDPASFAPYRYGLIALCFVPLVAAAASPGRWTGRVLGTRWLRWLGERSYGLYIFHFIVRSFYENAVGEWLDGGTATFLGWVLTTSVVAEISFRLFEHPILRLRERIEPRLFGAGKAAPRPNG